MKKAEKEIYRRYLTFRLHDEAYGMPIEVVKEIIQSIGITPVPETPAYVAGIINLRGKVIPVIDLRLKFGLEAGNQTKQTCIVVIDGSTGPTGAIVDSVSDVIELEESQIEPYPVANGETGTYSSILGIGKLSKGVLVIIDIVKALSPENQTGVSNEIVLHKAA